MSQPDLRVVLAAHERPDRAVSGFDNERLVFPSLARDRRFFGQVIDRVSPDIVHDHGIWMANNHQVVRAAHKRQVPVVISPRGMLEPWSLCAKKWKKKIALWLYQRQDLSQASMLHATAVSEAEQFRKLGLRQPIAVIANGVNLPRELPEKKLREDGRSRALFISRIHPKKGLVELIEAWALLKPNNWVLEIVGTNADDYQRIIERTVFDRGIADMVIFSGPLDDEKKWEAYRRADLFVLPTYSENFGIVIAEALFAEVPVITTKGAPWQDLLGWQDSISSKQAAVRVDLPDRARLGTARSAPLTDGFAANGRCGWWIDIGLNPLVVALGEALNLSDDARRQMGLNGRKLVDLKYTWCGLAKEMGEAYSWLLHGGNLPKCVWTNS